jgi:hypothetical protein
MIIRTEKSYETGDVNAYSPKVLVKSTGRSGLGFTVDGEM